MSQQLRQALLSAALIAVFCAAIVWWLERYETARMHDEIGTYLHRYSEFREWLASKGETDGET